MTDGNNLPQIIKLLKEKAAIAICLPIQPTLDATSSALALYQTLLKEGKSVSIVCSDEINPDFMLPGQENISSEIQAPGDTLVVSIPIENTGVENVSYSVDNGVVKIVISPEEGLEKFNSKNVQYSYTGGKPDLIVAIYAPTLESLGELYTNHNEVFQNIDIINIDRHFTNANFGTINFVDKQAPSMSQMIFELIKELKTEIDKDMATNLYTGLSTATNNFSAHTVNSQTFRLAALLLEKGAERRAPRPMTMGMPGGMRMPMGAGAAAGMPMGGFGMPQMPQGGFPSGLGAGGSLGGSPFDLLDQPMMPAQRAPQAQHVQQVPQQQQVRPQTQAQQVRPQTQAQPQAQPQQQPKQAQQPRQQVQPKQPEPQSQPVAAPVSEQEDAQIGTSESKEQAPHSIPMQNTAVDDNQAEDWLKPKIFQNGSPMNPMQGGGSGMKI